MNDVSCREKYWDEMDPDQKIRKLGDAVSTLWNRVKTLETENMRLLNHKHFDGELVTNIKGYDDPCSGYRYDPLNRKR